MYVLTRDSDCHWFVIPKDKQVEWNEYLMDLEDYWDSAEGELLPIAEPDQPEWAVMVGGAYNLVSFPSYTIE